MKTEFSMWIAPANRIFIRSRYPSVTQFYIEALNWLFPCRFPVVVGFWHWSSVVSAVLCLTFFLNCEIIIVRLRNPSSSDIYIAVAGYFVMFRSTLIGLFDISKADLATLTHNVGQVDICLPFIWFFELFSQFCLFFCSFLMNRRQSRRNLQAQVSASAASVRRAHGRGIDVYSTKGAVDAHLGPTSNILTITATDSEYKKPYRIGPFLTISDSSSLSFISNICPSGLFTVISSCLFLMNPRGPTDNTIRILWIFLLVIANILHKLFFSASLEAT